ncbi:MAG: uracil-DNA glycosylase [Bacteroidales bacterium]|jgi:uracil-DNA glycosylase|nr:uracil-DNA glycosylase [Bacteroidales bacterium]
METTYRDWNEFFISQRNEAYAKELHAFLDDEYARHTVFPPRHLLFNAFDMTPLDKVRVVMIGQDPYHEVNQAMGLCFSVPKGTPLPPSLMNIYKEIETDLNIKMDYSHGDLSCWARQGVLMLNAYLSVRQSDPLSHRHRGYDEFFKRVISLINSLNQPIVFLLWGSFAKSLKRYLNNPTHLILESVHPSPLAANRGGWFGQHHFSKANGFLNNHGEQPIDWRNSS